MKRIYIQPETELVVCRTMKILEGSFTKPDDPETEWDMGGTKLPGDQPDPNAESKGWSSVDLWDDLK